MDEKRSNASKKIMTLCAQVPGMGLPDVARALGVHYKTLKRWLDGETVMDVVHYFDLQDLVNSKATYASRSL